MVILENDQFLSRLTRMFEKAKDGTIRISMKRHLERLPADGKEETEPMCILRVKVGKQRATTKIPYSDHARFQVNIANLFRVYMDGLKKRDRREMTGDKSRSKRTVQ